MTSLRSVDRRRPRRVGGSVEATVALGSAMPDSVPPWDIFREDLLSVTLTFASDAGMMTRARIAPPSRSSGDHDSQAPPVRVALGESCGPPSHARPRAVNR